ncbi:M56 family metallopeptidase [Wenjunlia tyrosinilytica]|uniref:Peptidase M48 n=1 Tax=Wenjunlia tyrosinilytica TaxID=1544741 RepID=A0A917ZNP6_9ACTN|nr:M56 family metallopeptidase [Wenjunlia tyrosinilytica]GGO87475.1 peptidase M48 [Wenjunlia tyrosinilytica]
MYFAVHLPLLLPLAAVPALRALAPHLAPHRAAWMLAGAAVLLAAISTLALLVLVAMGVSEVPLLAVLGHYTPGGLPGVPGTAPLTACAAVAALAVGLSRTVRRAALHSRGLSDALSYGRGLADDRELVVLPDRSPLAYALPGRPGRIVVSSGMLHALDPAERRALLAHERAHLAGHHHVLLIAAELAAAANPLLHRLLPVLSYAVERSADEAAAAEVGDRTKAAHAVARAALAAHAGGGPHPAALHAGTGPVPQRVAALLAPPPARMPNTHTSRAVAVVVAGLLALGIGACVESVVDLHSAVETAQAAYGESD